MNIAKVLVALTLSIPYLFMVLAERYLGTTAALYVLAILGTPIFVYLSIKLKKWRWLILLLGIINLIVFGISVATESALAIKAKSPFFQILIAIAVTWSSVVKAPLILNIIPKKYIEITRQYFIGWGYRFSVLISLHAIITLYFAFSADGIYWYITEHSLFVILILFSSFEVYYFKKHYTSK